jgi:DNA-binding transcriptional regulator YdaS (Cro superfamily)
LLHRRFLEEAIAAGLPAKGLDQAFAQKIEVSPSMWSQIKSSRPIGDTLARQIERHCEVEIGWLDREDLAADIPDPAEERFIAAARQAWRAANAKGKRELARWLQKEKDDASGALSRSA